VRGSYQRQLEALEALYRDLLVAALRRCAEGEWGLFGHNDAALADLGKLGDRLLSKAATDLLALGAEIETLRHKLGYAEPFPLHARLMRMRTSADANTPGEPKLARQWLDELSS